MPFPTELNMAAGRQLVRFFTGVDRDYGRVTLAAWELTGFALGRAFNDPNFMSDMVQQEPELIAALSEARGDKLKELLEKYGPLVLSLVLKLLLKAPTPA